MSLRDYHDWQILTKWHRSTQLPHPHCDWWRSPSIWHQLGQLQARSSLCLKRDSSPNNQQGWGACWRIDRGAHYLKLYYAILLPWHGGPQTAKREAGTNDAHPSGQTIVTRHRCCLSDSIATPGLTWSKSEIPDTNLSPQEAGIFSSDGGTFWRRGINLQPGQNPSTAFLDHSGRGRGAQSVAPIPLTTIECPPFSLLNDRSNV